MQLPSVSERSCAPAGQGKAQRALVHANSREAPRLWGAGRGCFHTAGRMHIQPCHAQVRDHPSHICSLLRGWHSPPQSMESAPHYRRQLHPSCVSEHAETSLQSSALAPQSQQCWDMAVATVGTCRPWAAACFGQCVPSPILYTLHLPRSISNLLH